MKKFTSLFALLSCLCVVSAQAEQAPDPVTIYVDASNISGAKLYWWGATTSVDFNNSPLISSLDFETINGTTFYKKTLTPSDANVGISVLFWQWDSSNGKTSNITGLKESKYYFKYNGGDSYSVPVVTLGISSSVDNWRSVNPIFEYVDNNTWSCTWDLSTVDQNVDFKLRPNLIYYAGKSNNTINAAEGWAGGDDNITLNHPSTGCKKYQITAHWNTNIYTENGWTIDIKGILELTDDVQFNTNSDFTAASATYSRNSGSNQWGTLCLPFAFQASDNMALYTIDRVENSVMYFTTIREVSAGQPCIFKLNTPGKFTITENNVQVVTAPQAPTGNEWQMFGSFTGTSSGEDIYYYISNVNGEEGVYYGTGITIPAYRAWFIAPDGFTPAPLRFSTDETEGLQIVEQEDGTVKAYYDLQGRKLDSARKGLVIENGKIIMKK